MYHSLHNFHFWISLSETTFNLVFKAAKAQCVPWCWLTNMSVYFKVLSESARRPAAAAPGVSVSALSLLISRRLPGYLCLRRWQKQCAESLLLSRRGPRQANCLLHFSVSCRWRDEWCRYHVVCLHRILLQSVECVIQLQKHRHAFVLPLQKLVAFTELYNVLNKCTACFVFNVLRVFSGNFTVVTNSVQSFHSQSEQFSFYFQQKFFSVLRHITRNVVQQSTLGKTTKRDGVVIARLQLLPVANVSSLSWLAALTRVWRYHFFPALKNASALK